MNKLKRILVLADNHAEFENLTPAFADLPFGWKVHFSNSPVDALCVLNQVQFDLIFVDLKAGTLEGIQFLHEVWLRHPQTIRFLVGSSFDPDVMLTCVMGSHQFLHKPLTTASVRDSLERAEITDRLLHDKSVQNLVSRIRTFPARPTIYVEVMKELRSANASAQSVGELVSKDLAISTKLIQVINTAPFGLLQPVTTPADAVLMLGMEITASLVLGIEAFAQLDRIKPLYFSLDQVWRHSQTVAHSAKKIAEVFSSDRDLIHDAFTAGLLHDLGKIALAMNIEEQYNDALSVAREKKIRGWQAENEVLGASHAEAGAYLLSLWGLPAGIIESVAAHHQPAASMARSFNSTVAVHLANNLEFARHAWEAGKTDATPDLDYPAELRLHESAELLRQIASLPRKFELEQRLRQVEPKAVAETVSLGISSPEEPQIRGGKSWFTRVRTNLLRA
jgi:putative nucleotidyltransferase with HDIG domain